MGDDGEAEADARSDPMVDGPDDGVLTDHCHGCSTEP